MVYTFARVGAAVFMKVEDFFVQGRQGWVRLHEKGGKEHEMPTHHNLDRYLEEYIAAAGIAEDRKRAALSYQQRARRRAGNRPLLQSNVWRMIRRRAAEAGIETEIGCPHLPGHRNHRLPEEWRPLGDRPADCRA